MSSAVAFCWVQRANWPFSLLGKLLPLLYFI
jgi:lipid-A-disaccharide synthase-like uncharacterized protein